jgi:NAD(P)-dependent dehydrogenase (short-subunit alcohol dehydrogenase family)
MTPTGSGVSSHDEPSIGAVPRWLDGQVAVITGASKGIGAGIAETLAAAGATVVVTGRSADEAREEAGRLAASGHRALGLELDVLNTDSCQEMAHQVLTSFGRLDLLVNNAGISNRMPLVEMADPHWDEMIAVNLTGVERVTRAVVPHMIERRTGSIVSISSIAGRVGKENMTHYCATKFGVIGFTRALAYELAPFNIRVNCVCPGIIRTRLWEIELEEIAQARGITVAEAWDATVREIPLGRPQTAVDIGAAVAFLGSGLASNITGQSLNVDGGFVMS